LLLIITEAAFPGKSFCNGNACTIYQFLESGTGIAVNDTAARNNEWLLRLAYHFRRFFKQGAVWSCSLNMPYFFLKEISWKIKSFRLSASQGQLKKIGQRLINLF